MPAISFADVVKTFGAVKAVNQLALQVREGEILGFLGANGAGKTTAIKMLLGFIRPDQGKVEVLGGDPRANHTRHQIGFMPESAYYYPYLNLRELLRFYGGLCGLSGSTLTRRSEMLINRVGLQAAAGRLLRTYSKGMLQRAGIAQALLHDPRLLILDEPFTGLDPLARIQLRDLIVELQQQGKTIFFSSHELSEAELICDRVAILKQGHLVKCDSIQALAGDGRHNLERIFLRVLEVQASGEETQP